MTERTSHLAGLWIGAAISNTSHPNKAGSTTVIRARHCCHNKHKKFPIDLHTMYLYFPDTPPIIIQSAFRTVSPFKQKH
jgi:hypothetical protein